MKNKSCSIKRILALVLALITLLPCAPALAESYVALVADDGLAVYADAGFESKIAELNAYTPVKVTGEKEGKARIQYEGYTLYTKLDGLTKAEEIAIPGVAKQDTRVFESPDLLSRSAEIKKGTQMNVLAVHGDWAMVEKDGNVAYAYVDHLTPAAAEEEETQPESGNDPFLPGTDAEENIPDSEEAAGVTIETVAAKVTASKLPVYKSASTDSKLLGTMKKGTEVTVYAYNSDWAYIGLNGKYGFCALSGLEKVHGTEPEENDTSVDLSNAIPATVTAERVKVYASASTSAETLGTLKKGAQVNVVKVSGDWAFIELNGKLGYCAVAALTKTSDLETETQPEEDDSSIGGKQPLGTATVVEGSAPVYKSRKVTTPIATLTLGETLSYYGYDSKWVLVGRDGSFGYVQRKYLSAESYAELETDDTGSAVKDLEKTLLELGYLDSVPGTTYTAYTADAVSRLQEACGMTQTGRADIATLRVLYSGNVPASPLLSLTLSSGSVNANVKRIQTRLLSLGYLSKSSSVDGDYGSTTAKAVKLFQTAAGISATGTADSATIRALYSASAPTLPSGSTAADAAAVNTGSGASGNSSSMSSDLASTTDQYVAGMSNAKKLEYVIYVAQQQLGKPYVFGSAGTSSFDCSGFTMYCFKQVGVSLRHSAYGEGYNDNFPKISAKSSLRRGDLVFFNTLSDSDQCDHVGIYLGNDYFIHASSGAGKIVVSGMGSGYYSRVYSWGRRILET